MTSVAELIGANRIITGKGITNPVGDTGLEGDFEKEVKREVIELALGSLQEKLDDTRIYSITAF